MKKRTLFRVLILGLAFFLFDQIGAFNWLRKRFDFFSLKLREKTFQKIIGPEEELEKLRKELVSCRTNVFELKEENVQARRLLDAGVSPEKEVILGKLVGGNDSQVLIFLAGQSRPEKGASVISGRILVGRVKEITGQMARVALLSSREEKTPVKIWASEAEAGKEDSVLAEGILLVENKALLIKEILMSEKIEPGNLAGAVSEQGEVFLIGEVTQVFPSKDKIFQEAEVEWLVNPKKLLTVGIVN